MFEGDLETLEEPQHLDVDLLSASYHCMITTSAICRQRLMTAAAISVDILPFTYTKYYNKVISLI